MTSSYYLRETSEIKIQWRKIVKEKFYVKKTFNIEYLAEENL